MYILIMDKYDHNLIDRRWQKVWEENKLYETPDQADGKPNFYALVEFPYPSGNLHIGHWYAFAVPDIFARMKRMQGYNVMFPIGFDAFGLPAENAAIKNGVQPKKWTYENIAHMEWQLRSMGASFDWSRKIVTSDPEYYRWTQWLFLKFFEKGLAYKKKASVNWCPSCQTVLANEQVINGKCERCGSDVTEKELEQWFFKITDYAERLLADLDSLHWPEAIKDAQRNWIGRSEGAEIEFEVRGTKCDEKIKVFTTRADTLFGATYVVIAPEHEITQKILNHELGIMNYAEVEEYVKSTKSKTEIERTDEKKEKSGVEIKGIKAINPATREEIPVFVADYVLGSYGMGAVMAVPAHDERDYEFAKKYNLPIKKVIGINITDKKLLPPMPFSKKLFASSIYIEYECWPSEGYLINSGEFNYLTTEKAREKITEKFGKKEVKYKLRDWLLSRQRYWGCPIPIVYDPDGKPHPIPEKFLPWLLPEDIADFAPKGESPIATSKELKERVEKIFGKGWEPECDTMDTFVDSSWYFLRYCDPHNSKLPFDKHKTGQWMPVKRYSGGAEHTTMHLLYSRFFHKALFDMGLVNEPEPFEVRMNRGLILGPDGQKMSKSRGNVVDPDEWVKRVGADTVRTYLAFIGPYNEVGQYPWDLGGIAGVRRFLERVWKLAQKVDITRRPPLKVTRLPDEQRESTEQSEAGIIETGSKLENLLHKTIKKVGEDIENFKFNTAISAMMIFVNEMEKEVVSSKQPVAREFFEIFLKLLSPFAPHMAEELWHKFGNKNSIHTEPWPAYDKRKIADDSVTIVVQINGKVRASFKAPIGISEDEAKEKALSMPEVKKWLNGSIKKVIFVKGRVLNFVI